MAFELTIDPQSALAPDYAGDMKIERWTATAGASDSGPATIQARHLLTITDFDLDVFGGSGPSSYQLSSSQLILTLPGTDTATLYRIRLLSRY